MSVGTLPSVLTSDHVTNNIIKKGAKIFIPKGISVQRYTPEKNLPFINRMVEAGILQKTRHKPLNTIALFAVPKSDPRNPRMIMDFKPFTKLTNAPKFQLPNINKLILKSQPHDHMIKFDLINVFFHIPLDPKTSNLFGIKCQNNYYKITKLPQGLSVSPYIMQRVITSIIISLLSEINIRFLIYLDDILLLGPPSELEKAKLILLSSSFLFNLTKYVFVRRRIISYLGVNINLDKETLSLTKTFVPKVVTEMIKGNTLLPNVINKD